VGIEIDDTTTESLTVTIGLRQQADRQVRDSGVGFTVDFGPRNAPWLATNVRCVAMQDRD